MSIIINNGVSLRYINKRKTVVNAFGHVKGINKRFCSLQISFNSLETNILKVLVDKILHKKTHHLCFICYI